jgi:pre-mRNA-processing factor 19
MLGHLQTEWDGMILETYEMRKHLENVRKQLAHTLYQHDAACRVISRLIQERDEARQALALTQDTLADYKDKINIGEITKGVDLGLQKKDQSYQIEADNCGIYPDLEGKINKCAESLFNMRKERKKPDDYYKPSDFNLLTEKACYPVHSTTFPGACSVDIHKEKTNYICSGGNDGSIVILDKSSGKLTHNFGDSATADKIQKVEFTKNGLITSKHNGTIEYYEIDLLAGTANLKTKIHGCPGVLASAHPLDPYMICGVNEHTWGLYNFETGTKLCQVELKEGMKLTSLRVHPDGLMVATGSDTGVITLWDLRSQKAATNLEGHTSAVTKLEFSEKAIHLASATDKDNVVKLWNLKKTHKPPQNLVHQQGTTVRGISFDPYGSYIVTACDKNLCFYEVSNAETCLFELPANDGFINGVKFAMDASYIATASEDRVLKIFQQ